MLLEGEPPANSSLAINPATGYNSDWEEGSMTLTEVATTLDAHMVGPAMDEANGKAHFITPTCEPAGRRPRRPRCPRSVPCG